jgi:hypothetical protein
MINYLTPSHLLSTIPFMRGVYRLGFLTFSISLLDLSHLPLKVASTMSWTQKTALVTQLTTPAFLRNPLVTCSGSMVLFCYDYREASATFDVSVVNSPVDSTIVKMRCV